MSLGFVFPGQGAQEVGMGREFLETDESVSARFAEANDALGFDIGSIILKGPRERLSQTEITQPALLTIGIALWDAWQARGGPTPAFMAGHSLGEYTALAAAGSIEFVDAVRLVNERGRFMQEAVPIGEGAMAAILALDDDVVAECCQKVAGIVQPANINAPGQIVISGAIAAVEAAVKACTEAGARRAMLLDVSAPFHCVLMEPAAERLREVLKDIAIKAPSIPVVHNVDATIASDPEAIRQKLIQQVYNPVRWRDCVTVMRDRGVDWLVECGPGKVLSGIVRRIDKSLRVQNIGNVAGMLDALT
jgi:[acyl-carrier-protein] S-malonyltransferase